jgi:DNA replication ATP-dependent helicase Dna2
VTLTERGTRRLVHLKDRWADVKVRPKDIVNIVSHALDGDGPIVVTMKDTAACLIHHPDILVTMTAVADAMPCPRRPLVNSLIKLPGAGTKAMLYGTVLHSLLQGSLSEQSFDAASTQRRVEAELAREECRLDVWGAGLNPEDVTEDLAPKATEAFATFGQRWVKPAPTDDSVAVTARDEACGLIAIKGLHDIEEAIWSPKWGLQGKVDASIQAVLRRGDEETEFVAPLEIKTGKSIGGLNHRAQTMLYTLLMEDRYGELGSERPSSHTGLPIPAGLLYYSQRSAIVLVEARANEVRALIMTRNELAEWMARERASKADEGDAFLPETLDRPNDCKRCFAADACMLYRKVS